MGSNGTEMLDAFFTITLYFFNTLTNLSSQAGPDLQLLGEGGNQNVEAPIGDKKFRLWQLFFLIFYNI